MAGKTRGAGARRRRSARRAAMQRSVRKPTQQAVVASGLTDEQAAEFLALAELAPMPSCANCEHSFDVHQGDEGPCTIESCECQGYTAAEASAAAEVPTAVTSSSAVAIRLVFNQASAVASVAQALAQSASFIPGDAPLPDGTLELGQVTDLSLEELQRRFAAAVADPPLPAEHAPGASGPAPASSPEPTPPAVLAETQWAAILCPEGKLTSDGRAFAPGSITWRELPLTLMAMTETSEGGHIGAEVAGRIDEIWRDEAAGLIRARGVFADTEYGSLIAAAAAADPHGFERALAASLVTDEVLRGVSVDLAIHNYEVGPRSDWFDEDGNWAPKPTEERQEPSILDMLMGTEEPTIAVVTAAEIGMTTVCPFPAFSEAKIVVGESLVAGANPAFWTVTGQAGWITIRAALSGPVTASVPSAGGIPLADCGCGEGALTASAAGLAPVAPPAAWFDDPELEGPTALTVDEEGRIIGHAALWGVCHIGLPGCRTAPHSTTDYGYFHLGEIELDDGARVACGQITIDAPHAGLQLDGQDATAHYDHTGTVVAHVRVGEDEHGIWVAGALEPTACAEKVRLLRGAKLSGDWRKFPDTGHELVALLAVNVPGFPVPRPRASIVASAEAGTEEVLALVAAGIPLDATDLSPDEQAQFAALALGPEFNRLTA